MATKQNVLDLLSRDELLAAVDRLGLAVRDRRARAGLLHALTASKKTRLSDLLGFLPRERLRELCRELDLDDDGRNKAALIELLTGARMAEQDGGSSGRVYDPCCGSSGMFVQSVGSFARTAITSTTTATLT